MDFDGILPASMKSTPKTAKSEELKRRFQERIAGKKAQLSAMLEEQVALLQHRGQLKGHNQTMEDFVLQARKYVALEQRQVNECVELLTREREQMQFIRDEMDVMGERIAGHKQKAAENKKIREEKAEQLLQIQLQIEKTARENSEIRLEMQQLKEQDLRWQQLNADVANKKTTAKEFTDSIKSSEMELVQMENKNEVAREEIRALLAEKERAASKHALKLEEKTKAQQKLDNLRASSTNPNLVLIKQIEEYVGQHKRNLIEDEKNSELKYQRAIEKKNTLIEENANLSRVIKELDETLARKQEDLKCFKDDLEKNKEEQFYNDPEIRPLHLRSERTKCRISQLEENVRDNMHLLEKNNLLPKTKKNVSLTGSDLAPSSTVPNKDTPQPSDSMAMTTMRSSTPTTLQEPHRRSLSHSFPRGGRGGVGGGGDETLTGNDLNLSFDSNFTISSIGPQSRVPNSSFVSSITQPRMRKYQQKQRRPKKARHDEDKISSTQN